MGRTQLNHLTRADEQDPLIGKPLEDPLGKMNGCGRHRDRIGTDRSRGSDFLCNSESPLKELVEQGPKGASLFSLTSGLLHLTEDLGFPRTIESSPLATLNTCRTASRCG